MTSLELSLYQCYRVEEWKFESLVKKADESLISSSGILSRPALRSSLGANLKVRKFAFVNKHVKSSSQLGGWRDHYTAFVDNLKQILGGV